MFPLGPEREPEPDVIGTARPDRGRGRWRRYAMGSGALALAGIIAVTSLSSRGHHAAAPAPSASPSGSVPAVPAPVVPVPIPSRAWVVSLNIAIWPMPGQPHSRMFAGGLAGNQGWQLTVRDVARPGRPCAAEVMLNDTDAYLLPARPALRTPVGDLAFIALGVRAHGVGLGFLQVATPGTQLWLDPADIGGLQVTVPVVTVTACGRPYYLAGFAYPLAGTLHVIVMRNGSRSADYVVPTRLSRPAPPGVWQSTGLPA